MNYWEAVGYGLVMYAIGYVVAYITHRGRRER